MERKVSYEEKTMSSEQTNKEGNFYTVWCHTEGKATLDGEVRDVDTMGYELMWGLSDEKDPVMHVALYLVLIMPPGWVYV